MSLVHYFLSPDGRISRLAFWLGLIALMAISVPVTAMLDPWMLDLARKEIRPPSLGNTIWSLLLTWPSAAISIKRFNDRGRPRWVGYLLALLMVVLVIGNHFGVFLDPDRMGPVEKVAFLGLLGLFMWSLIDNGFMKGTGGTNKYGPDPLQ